MAYVDIGAIQEGSGRDIGAIESQETAAGVEITLDAVSASFSVPNPSIDADVTVSLTITSASFSVPNPGIQADVGVTLTAASAVFSVPDPTLDVTAAVGDEIALDPVSAAFSVATPSIGADVDLVPVPVSAAFSVPNPTLATPTTITLGVAEANFSMAMATISGQFTTVDPTASEVNTVAGMNRVVLIAGPVALTAGQEVRVVVKVSSGDSSSATKADKTTLSLFKV